MRGGKRLIYEPNTVTWKRGDLVCLDDEEKKTKYLALVLAVDNGRCSGVYPFHRWDPRTKRPETWSYPLTHCHDPSLFNVAVPDWPDTCQKLLKAFAPGAILSKEAADALLWVGEILQEVRL
jgi:hypothetical protein